MQPFKFVEEAGPINADLSWFLDISRALAAFLVVIGHVKTVVFGESILAKDYLSSIFTLITGLGHQGVVIFFVLSGFLVGRKAVDAVVLKKSNIGHYILDRATRIYVVLIPAILIGAMWDWILINQLDKGDAYTYIQHRYDFVIAMGNVFALQTILVPVFGSNGPLWSLANETWYYVLYPLALYVFISTGTRRAILFAVLALLLVFVGMDITKYAALWLLGACVLHLNLPLRIPRSYLYVTLGVLIAASNSPFLKISGVGFGYDMVIGLVISFLIREYQLAPLIGGPCAKSLVKKLANFSYSLYLYHFPLLIVIGYFINKSGNGTNGTNLDPYLLWLLIVTFLYLYSYGLSLISEAKYHSVRSFLYAQLMGARPVQR